ncbi:hypothetical protein [Klebsiella oxytoca]|uniref:hypothetical protein n=1 Tax=Klebsiella oxytoca TaxID=571 RepID=UPI000D770A73|nr:hypothetical protein [Klebsiella oxytoca]HCB1499404.1 hypothetical protein [Klebsiella michiganensis]HCB1846676.1 hypothetical protein [Klebsiella oxytoca]
MKKEYEAVGGIPGMQGTSLLQVTEQQIKKCNLSHSGEHYIQEPTSLIANVPRLTTLLIISAPYPV